MLELIAGVLLAAFAAYYVLRPVLHPPAAESSTTGMDEGEDPGDDLSPQAVALRALKEIEFDRATGKLSDTDYDELKRKYEAAALAALRGEGAPAVTRAAPAPAAQRAPAVAGASRAPACPTHGRRPEADALFCSECGRRLGAAAAGYCVRCGSALASDSRYCNGCGARIAA
jgi:hypothetical protein